MSQHRKDNLGPLFNFIRTSSPFYSQLPQNVTSVNSVPITDPDLYWSRQNEVLTAPITADIVIRSGSPTDNTKKVYLTKEELSTATSMSANVLVAQGTGLQPGDRVANIAHRKFFFPLQIHNSYT
jgi:hypothetical protein